MTRKEALYNPKLAVLAYSNQDQIKWDELGLFPHWNQFQLQSVDTTRECY